MIASLCPTSLAAFDTGHHRDVTWTALQREGFSQDAVKVVILQNWLIDYYAALSEVADNTTGNALLTQDLLYQDVAGLLHFDNLDSPAAIEGYWRKMTFNTYCAVHALLSEKPPDTDTLRRCGQRGRTRSQNVLAVLTLLGVSLHAVQDFYSHSNWVELQQELNRRAPGTYSVETWFDRAQTTGFSKGFTSLRTGRYGPGTDRTSADHHDQMSHDNLERPDWDRAYVFAYAGSRQWINQFRLWVEEARPGFWADCVLPFVASAELKRELANDLAHSFSLSTVAGKWKGLASAAESEAVMKLQVATAASTFIRQSSTFRREFTEAFIFMKVVPDLSFERMNRARFDQIPVIRLSRPNLPATEVPVIIRMGIRGTRPFFGQLFARVRIGDIINGHIEGCAFGTFGNWPLQCFDESILVRSGEPRWTVIWFQEKAEPETVIRVEPWQISTIGPTTGAVFPLTSLPQRNRVVVTTATGECRVAGEVRSCTQASPLDLMTSAKQPDAMRVSVTLGSLVR